METNMPTTNSAPPSAASVPSPAMAPAPKRGFIGIILGVVGVLVVGAVGAYAYVSMMKTPEEVVTLMSKNMSALTSVAYSAAIDATLEGVDNPLGGASKPGEEKPMTASLTLSGVSELENVTDPKSMFALSLALSALPQGSRPIGLEVRTIAKDVYAQLTSVPTIGIFDLSIFANNWVKIDKESLAALSPADETEDDTEGATKDQLTEQQLAQIRSILSSAKFFIITEELSKDKIADQSMYHYLFALDEAEVTRVVREINVVVKGGEPSAEDAEKLADLLAHLDVSNGNLWIGTSDLYLHKISFDARVQEMEEGKGSGTISVVLEHSDFNKPVVVEAPTEVKTIEEMFQMFMGGPSASLDETSEEMPVQ